MIYGYKEKWEKENCRMTARFTAWVIKYMVVPSAEIENSEGKQFRRGKNKINF